MSQACASRAVTFGPYPRWHVRRTLFVTPGCFCDRCVQLRAPEVYALAKVMEAIACAVLMADLVPHLCWGLKR